MMEEGTPVQRCFLFTVQRQAAVSTAVALVVEIETSREHIDNEGKIFVLRSSGTLKTRDTSVE